MSELVREGLRLIEDKENEREAALAGLRRAIDIGWQQSERGEVLSGPKVFDEIRQLSNSRRRKAAG